ncbi:malto-oligosyltrehalose trehalohydrolase [Cellulomonas fimi]|uniref:Malto-oligosyltrehalose trehalohydrolase n=1 Tax=Cellulomonas fimi (strain ATCC 484 / DSM 20113 / JCM 1341 / CCUG 24087 / LMG 16345 / NBRC 15513 / NCIMB 8980 / NCTC 7547 / NRS-133) TaxID=590998 RepID=F4H0Z3_CELFA|nr:malto-oligosyltrehalose trehalohydrolase [Cellulomonas fimi]AEE46240.1 malto-oligosyltrehalose trehalohydrolase [Cellulomonas fimi ATCC 484]NNH06179.1 malto-oligosyltrehalose trehalohydrolase [Cellulomonas fimi]VEH32195.1 Malto-oligosyltrehalose trehalohydrolase [Cellulomonas fimi]
MQPRVWAPDAGRVDLVLPSTGARVPLSPDDDGWWSGDTDLPHGTDYAFALDDGPPLPDPRSAWQPDGVHGPSRVLDTDAFAWTDQGWAGLDVRGRVLYELHVGTFTPEGTLDAAAAALPDLVSLGVDVVELMPVAPFDGPRGWGYDGVGLYAVHEPYGGPAALARFVDVAHGLGLAVCLDVVHNHLGPSGNYTGSFGPYATDAHHTPWGSAINLDQPGSSVVRRWIVDSALRWLRDFHVDALRLDAVHELRDDSGRHVLAQLSDEVADLSATLGRPLSLVAETDLNDVVSVAPTHVGGWGVTGQWADDVHHALHALVTGERHGYYVDFGAAPTLRQAFTGVFVHAGTYSTFRGRTWGRPVPSGTDGHRFVVCAQNHDQVGNRALGDRPSERLDADTLAAEAALLLLSPFTPMLFQGEEWGTRTPFQFFTSFPDPDLGRAVSEGRRGEFGGHGWTELYGGPVDVPDPQDEATFRRSVLDRAEREAPGHARLLAWYRELVALRRSVPDLGSGDLAVTDLEWDGPDEADGPWHGVLVLHRGAARVVVNLTAEERSASLPAGAPLDVAAAWGSARVEPGAEPRVVLGPGATVALVPASADA